jgi:hypothetical protein
LAEEERRAERSLNGQSGGVIRTNSKCHKKVVC